MVAVDGARGAPAEGEDAGPLSAEQVAQLVQAKARAAGLMRAARVAAVNGWLMAGGAAITLPFAVLDLSSLLIGGALAALAYNELRGSRMFKTLDTRAPRLLALNQLTLLALIFVYCGYSLHTGLGGPGLEEALREEPEVSRMLDQMDDPALWATLDSMDDISFEAMDDIYRTVVLIVYTSVMVLSTIFQGLMAYYYYSKRHQLTLHLQSPKWVLELQRKGIA